MNEWRFWLSEQKGTLVGLAIFLLLFGVYIANHPAGLTANVAQTSANKGVLFAYVAMAQTLVVITAGIDLSVGMIFVLTNCVASWIVVGGAVPTGLGVIGVLLTGLTCGAVNGALVIYGRLQPIVATIATGAIYFGLALLLRPYPGGSVNETLADAMTGKVFGVIPSSLVMLAAVVLLVWVPFSRSVYASGSAYTLWSIAAVVLGGVSLYGGRGSAIGAIFGAFAARATGDMLFVFDVEPLWQPLLQGVVLMLAVSLGAFGLLRVRNRLEWFR
jgi:ribose transport system permease protein